MTASTANMIAQQPGQQHSPAELVDALHTAFGNNHSRAVHAKGVILEGSFIPATSARTLTTARHLQKDGSKVIVRFSNFTGIPNIPDNIGAANPRGLAIKFIIADGSTTDIISHSFNGFPTSTSDEFRELLLAIGASATEAAKPTQLDNFLATHPVAKRFLTTQKTPASYATINYFGVNTFQFTNKQGIVHNIRYQFVAEAGEHALTPEQTTKSRPEYLMDEIKTRIKKQPVKYKLYAQVAEDGDNLTNPSVAWPDSRKKILLGTIVLNKLSENTTEQDKALSFNPTNIPAGITTADPMLDFRSKAYPISVKERQ